MPTFRTDSKPKRSIKIVIIAAVVVAIVAFVLEFTNVNPDDTAYGSDQETAFGLFPKYLVEDIDGVDPEDIAAAYDLGSTDPESIGAQIYSASELARRASLQSDSNDPSVEGDMTGQSSDDANEDQTSASEESYNFVQPTEIKSMLVINNQMIPFITAYGADTAPQDAAGLWNGADEVNDYSWGYFIGHHPGVFDPVMNLKVGDQITVYDHNGNYRNYRVFNIFDVPETETWEQIAPEITSHGESIALQTCVGDNQTYRIVEAA